MQASAQTAQCWCLSPCALHSVGAGAAECDAVGELRFEQLAVAGLVRARHDVAGRVAHRGAIEVEPDAGDADASMSRSDRQASAQAVQVSTQLKHASMQRLMASEWAGFSGCDRNMARTATADMSDVPYVLPPVENPRSGYWFLNMTDSVQELAWREPRARMEFQAIRCGRDDGKARRRARRSDRRGNGVRRV